MATSDADTQLANVERPAVQWLDTAAVARRYDVPVATVRKWRHEGTGPAGVKFGRHVRYARAELERWERQLVITQAS